MIHGLPERLRGMREKLSYSQRNVADRLKVSPSLISGYETGERTPSVEVLLQLSGLYQCSTDYLLGRSAGGAAPSLSLAGLPPRQIRLLTALAEEFRAAAPEE